MHDERTSKADALAHAAGQFARESGFVAVEADQVDRGQSALADFSGRQTERLEPELHVFQDRQPGKQREGLKHHGDARRRAIYRLAEISDGAADRLR